MEKSFPHEPVSQRLPESMSHVFSMLLREWHLRYGRHDLPWQNRGPYATWISEIMLQQTQVTVVIPYFNRFMDSFPTVEALALASEDEVLLHWAGLGYYSRARNLHFAAKQICQLYNGKVPYQFEQLLSLRGVGRSTAGAILSLGHKRFGVIQDGNVRRVLSRFFAVAGDLTTVAKQNELWDLATQLTPRKGQDAMIHSQAIMDLGALICSKIKPRCPKCPLAKDCLALRHDTIEKFPGPKVKRLKRQETWIVLELKNTKGEIYFEKRSDKGIWGGLYAPPIGANLKELKERYFIDHALKAEYRSKLKHAFSHFAVTLEHFVLNVNSVSSNKNGIWTQIDNFNKGLPSPIIKLLNRTPE